MNDNQTTKTDLARFSTLDYHPGSKAKIILWYLFNRIFINTYFPFPGAIKRTILKLFGARIGRGVVIKPKVNIKYPWFLTVGNSCWIGENVWIDNLTYVKLGSDVCISQGALLLCGNHNYKRPAFDLILGPITLDEGVWIGAKAVVCPGVVCNSHAILTVGSVATKNLEAYTIYAGNPAEKVRTRVFEK
jgi:putative colanic acid biosynthesis acetyltransferase WcaF